MFGIWQGLTWLLPEKFSASEIGPEAGVFVILLVTILFLKLHALLVPPFTCLVSEINSSAKMFLFFFLLMKVFGNLVYSYCFLGHIYNHQ